MSVITFVQSSLGEDNINRIIPSSARPKSRLGGYLSRRWSLLGAYLNFIFLGFILVNSISQVKQLVGLMLAYCFQEQQLPNFIISNAKPLKKCCSVPHGNGVRPWKTLL